MTERQLMDCQTRIESDAKASGVTHFSTGVAVLGSNGQILLVRRVLDDFMGGNFEIAGGGVEEGENFASAASREVREETGLQVSEYIYCEAGFKYTSPAHGLTQQVNYIARCHHGDVRLDVKEHDAFAWVTRDEIDALEMSANMRSCLEKLFDLASAT